MAEGISSLTLRELEILSEVGRFSSLRALARAKNMDPSQLTRTLQKIELAIGLGLFERGHDGIKVTEDGLHVLDRARAIVAAAEDMGKSSHQRQLGRVLTLGSRGFLNYAFAPLIHSIDFAAGSQRPQSAGGGLVFRFLDMSPEELKIAEHKRLIEAAIHVENMEWSSTWQSSLAGTLQWAAYVRPGHPQFSKTPHRRLTIADVAQCPFVVPAYWVGTELRSGDDRFPLPTRQRLISGYAQSAMTAVEMARSSDSIVFAPSVVANEVHRLGLLQRLNLEGMEERSQEIYFSYRTDVMSLRERDVILNKMKSVLSAHSL